MSIIQIRNSLLFLFVTTFFFFPKAQTAFVSAAFFLTFFTGEFSIFKKAVFRNPLSWAFFAFFMIGVASLLWTQNLPEGLRAIEIKFSFLAFSLFLPVIFNSPNFSFSKLINGLTIVSILYVILSFARAFYLYVDTGNDTIFFSSTLGFRLFQSGPFVHPTYVSFYYLTLILIWGQNLIQKSNNLMVTSPLGKIGLLATFFIFVFFSSSKAGLLAMAIVVILLLALFAKREKKVLLASGLFVGFLIVALLGIYNTSLKFRFQQAYSEFTDTNLKPDANLKSTGTRIWIWKATSEVIKENPIIGVGLGDTRDELSAKYKQMGIKSLESSKLDSHEQFLQTFATLGLLGLVSLLFIFITIIVLAIRHKNFVLLGLGLIYLLFGFTESMLETQAGVVFFTFFAFFFASHNPSTNLATNE